MKRRIAHKVWKRYSAFPLSYSLTQIREAHALLGHPVDASRMAAWKAALEVEVARKAVVTEQAWVKKQLQVAEVDEVPTTRLRAYETHLEALSKGEEPPAPELPTTLSDLSVPDLKAMAKSNGLKGYSKLKKAELVDLLSSKV